MVSGQFGFQVSGALSNGKHFHLYAGRQQNWLVIEQNSTCYGLFGVANRASLLKVTSR